MQNELYINKFHLLLIFLLILSILPIINVMGYSIPVLYLLSPIGLMLLTLIFLGKIKIPKILLFIFWIFVIICIEIFISTMYGTVSTLNEFIFPSDIIQYVARLLAVISFALLFTKGYINSEVFIKYFLIFLNIAMLIGILQWIPWPGRELFIDLYPFRDGSLQESQLNRDLYVLRLHGFAQHATANGGLATFFFVFAYSIFKYYKKYKILSISLMILAFINIFASQSRAGILALVCVSIVLYLVNIYINKSGIKPTLFFVGFISIVSAIIYFLYEAGNKFLHLMVFRWENLFEESGGGRVDQLNYFFGLINNPMEIVFGLSKPVVNNSFISHGVEIEPAYIMTTYGLFGFILQYSLIIVLLVYLFVNLRFCKENKAILSLLVASFVGLISYQIFSIAFFFFREIRVGLFPWILIGVTIGVFEKYKKDRFKAKEIQSN